MGPSTLPSSLCASSSAVQPAQYSLHTQHEAMSAPALKRSLEGHLGAANAAEMGPGEVHLAIARVRQPHSACWQLVP
jgi:hypothetical protein